MKDFKISKETVMFLIFFTMICITVHDIKLQIALVTGNYWLSIIAEYLRELYNKKP